MLAAAANHRYGRQGAAIDFLTPATGFMVDHIGDLRRTVDGGRTWKSVSSGPHFVSLSFDSGTVGYGLTEHGRVESTRDGGWSWRTLRSLGASPRDGPFPGNVEFTDANHGWANAGDYVYRTRDGGVTWTRLGFKCGFSLGGFSFVDSSNGFLICGGQPATIEQEKDLYVTTDGGDTWHRRACVRALPLRCRGNLGLGGYAAGLAFRSARAGVLVSERAGITRTVDGGVHWGGGVFTDDEWSIVSTSWASARTVYALIEQDGSLLRSDDGGRRWRRVYPLEPGPPTGSVTFSSPTRGIGVAARALLQPAGVVATDDGGATWHRRATLPLGGFPIVRVNDHTVWALASKAGDPNTPPLYLVRSTDDGRHWRRMPTPPGLRGPTLSFPTAETGYLADIGNTLYRTSDGGKSWHRVPTAQRGIQGPVFVSPDEGLFVDEAHGGGLLHSRDNGRTWHPVAMTLSEPLNAVYALDARHWWLGTRDRLLRTADGGRSWTAIRISGLDTTSLDFVDPTVGYAQAAAGAGLLRTTDGGQTWRPVSARGT